MVNAVPRSKLHNRCETRERRLSIARATGEARRHSIVFFHLVLTEISGGCSLLYIYILFFLPNAIDKHWSQLISLSFGWCIWLCFITGRYRKGFLYNPLSLESATSNATVCYFERRREYQDTYEKVQALIILRKLPFLIFTCQGCKILNI